MKDETCGDPTKSFAGLKSKMFTFITEDNHDSKNAKDINENAVDDELKYEAYKNVLFHRSCMGHRINKIQSKYHNIQFHVLLTMIKNMYLKMFINLFINHIKIILSHMENCFNFPSSQNSYFICNFFLVIIIFSFNNTKEDHSQENEK